MGAEGYPNLQQDDTVYLAPETQQAYGTIFRSPSGRKVHQCRVCGYQTERKFNLSLHIKKHTGEKPFKCSQCPHRSARKGDILRHMRTHGLEVVLYECKTCNYKALSPSDLSTHVKEQHRVDGGTAQWVQDTAPDMGDPVHHCPHCDYKTITSFDLSLHIQNHHDNVEVKD